MSATDMSSSQRIQKALQEGDRDAYEREARHRLRTGMYIFISWIAIWWISLGIVVWALSE